MANQCRNGLKRGFSLLFAFLLLFMTLQSHLAFAETEEGNRWGSAADQIDQYLDAAFEYYLEGDAKNAYNSVNDAYFKIYEVTGFERQTMSYISGPRKNAVELAYSTCKGAVKKSNEDDETKTAVRTELLKLKEMIREDANKLATKDGEPLTEMKWYKGGEEVASDPYPEYAGDPDAEIKYASRAEAAGAVGELLDTAFTGYKGKDFEAAQDNFYTALYNVYETSGLGLAIYSQLGLEERQEMDALFDELGEIAAGEKFQRKAFQRQVNKIEKALNAKAERIDRKSVV